MDIYVKFAMTTHQIWSCQVTLASNSENFYFSPNSVSNFWESYQVWGKLAQEQKVTAKKQNSGWKTTPLPSVLIGLSTSALITILIVKYAVLIRLRHLSEDRQEHRTLMLNKMERASGQNLRIN